MTYGNWIFLSPIFFPYFPFRVDPCNGCASEVAFIRELISKRLFYLGMNYKFHNMNIEQCIWTNQPTNTLLSVRWHLRIMVQKFLALNLSLVTFDNVSFLSIFFYPFCVFPRFKRNSAKLATIFLRLVCRLCYFFFLALLSFFVRS